MTFHTPEQLEEYLNRITSKGFVLVNESWCAGYLSRNIAGKTEPYKGKFGKGVKIHIPCSYSTRYHKQFYYIYTKPNE